MIRLLSRQHTGDYTFHVFRDNEAPAYAILSHTWEEDNSQEVLYDEMSSAKKKDKLGFRKISFCADKAAEDGLQYFWIDSCCINKRSEIELSEAINSMFRWYRNAARCYVYLSDVPKQSTGQSCAACGQASTQNSAHEHDLRHSRWFTRGWTLQELIAPHQVRFYDQNGRFLGDKASLETLLHEVTGIAVAALRGESLSKFDVEERLSWSANRHTTRDEDMIYSLLGIFDVTMPLVYGERKEQALRRLRCEIVNALSHNPTEPAHKRRRIEANTPEVPSAHPTKAELIETLDFEEIEDRLQNIKQNYSKTCAWLLQDPAYLAWLSAKQYFQHFGFLWIKGKPGSGKSILTKYAFSQLSMSDQSSKSSLDRPLLLSFFFNARGSELERTTAGLYRALIIKIIRACPTSDRLDAVLRGLNSSLLRRLKTDQVALQRLLASLLCKVYQRNIVLVIDALDECLEDDVRDMIAFFQELGDEASIGGWELRIWFSSRHYPHISAERSVELILEGQVGHKQDITRYIFGKLKIGKNEQAERIRQQLQEKAAGIFLWVVLVVDILQKKFDHGHVRGLEAQLKALPDNLSELFRDILSRDESNINELRLCLLWVLHANRPLRQEELYDVLHPSPTALSERASVTEGREEPSADDMARFILSSSKGLAEVTKTKSRTVQFIHESVRDFLRTDQGLVEVWPELRDNPLGLCHNDLRQCCSTYLGLCSPQPCGWINGKFVPHFRDYAVRNVFRHADIAQREGVSQLRFLNDVSVDRWIAEHNTIEKFKIRRHDEKTNLMYVLADQDAPHLVRLHVQMGFDWTTTEPCGRYGNPVFAAIARKNRAVFDALVEHDRSTGNTTLKEMRSDTKALGAFLVKQDPDLVQELLSIYQFHADDLSSNNSILLTTHAGKNHQSLVRTILKSGTRTCANALDVASHKGYTEIVAMLLSHGADVKRSRSLELAIEGEHKKVIQLLLERGSRLVSSSSLVDALRKGHKGVFEVLAAYNAIPLPDNEILDVASEKGYVEIVSMLLFYGTDVNRSWPLELAVRGGHKEVAQLLLETGLRLERSTSLFEPSMQRHEGMSELLASHDAMPLHDHLALYYACQTHHRGLFESVLKRGVDVNQCRGQLGEGWIMGVPLLQYPLQAAAYHGYKDFVERLLENGADIEVGRADPLSRSHDVFDNGSSIYQAARQGHDKVISMLLRHGADVNALGRYHGESSHHSALYAASAWGHRNSVELLLAYGANVNALTQDGTTALFGAILGPDKALWPLLPRSIIGTDVLHIVKLLLKHGADITIGSWKGKDLIGLAKVGAHENEELAEVLSRERKSARHESGDAYIDSTSGVLMFSGNEVGSSKHNPIYL